MQLFLTYDFLSTRIDRGWDKHLEKFSFLIPIFHKLGVVVVKDNGDFSRRKLKRSIGHPETKNVFDPISVNDLNDEAIQYIREHISNYDIVFGYELLPQTREIFEKLDVTYIDMWLSPIRFYKDIMFEFYSNNKKIQNILNKHAFDEQKLFKEATRIKNYFNEFETKNTALENNSALLVGQVLEDKSVLKGKRYLDLLDFESEIKDLADQYNVLYFLKHPLMKNDEFQAFHQKLQKINNIEYLQNENSYYLLAQPEIKMVAGISSSVLSESLYFGKEIRYFYKPVIEKKYSRIYKSMFRLSFWAKVFDVATVKEKELFIYDNYLRLRYSLFYGYKVFMGIDLDKKLSQRSSYDNLIALFYFLQALDKEKKYILYGYGSVGKLIYPHIKENLVGIIDKSLREKDTVDGIKVLKEQQLNGYKDATILVTPYIHKEAIKQSLKHCENEVIFLQ